MDEGRERHNRRLELNREEPEACPEERMRHRMGTCRGKAVQAWRRVTVETEFGVINEALGFRQFSMRGHSAAGFEWRIVCTG